jgi:hypothetical protein
MKPSEKLLAKITSLRSDVNSLQKRMAELHKAQQQIGTPAKQVEHDIASKEPSPEVSANVHLRQTDNSDAQPYKQNEQRRDRIRIGVEFFGILLLIGTLVYSIRQYGVAQGAIKQAREQFAQDQRPYVWIGEATEAQKKLLNGQIPIFIDRNGRIYWHVFYTNYGKSPAVRLIAKSSFYTGAKSPDRLASGNPKLFSSEIISSEDDFRSGTVVPPGKHDYTTLVSVNTFSPSALREIKSMDGGVAIGIRFEYNDLSGTTYYSYVCLTRLATGAQSYCPGKNGIK